MRKPAVDYRKFRLRKINAPEFAHLKLLLGWVGYFALYFLTERLIPAEKCVVVHSRLDDLIPFCEWFVIPYVFWYGLIVFSLVWFLLYNVENFKALQTYIIITQVVAMAVYILLPNRQDLRPEVFPRDNFLTQAVGVLYQVDTSTNVCPSLHVAYSLGIASVWLREKAACRAWKAFVVAAVVLICLSTMFIKQHSAVDVIAALPVCALAEWIVFYRKK
ncbi:MAG: phosphatidic acid phosphatase [Oscillospiraceae bacterium]|nr:phosphatidic acid phosphatase [Oscillospiraceae bacterium]